jgi:putative endopeptidase
MYQGGIGLPDKDYYTDEKYEDIRTEYVPHISRMLMLAGWSATDAIDAAQAIYELEAKIAQHHWSRVESREAEKTYNLKDLEQEDSLGRIPCGC